MPVALLVEDDLMIQDFLQRFLRENGYEVHVTDSVQTAYGWMFHQEVRPDLLWTDNVTNHRFVEAPNPPYEGTDFILRVSRFFKDTACVLFSDAGDDPDIKRFVTMHGGISLGKPTLAKPENYETALEAMKPKLLDAIEQAERIAAARAERRK